MWGSWATCWCISFLFWNFSSFVISSLPRIFDFGNISGLLVSKNRLINAPKYFDKKLRLRKSWRFRKVKIIFCLWMCRWKRQVEQSSRGWSGWFLELISSQSQLRRTSQLSLFKPTMHVWHLVCGSRCSLERDGSAGGWEESVSVRKWKVHRRLGSPWLPQPYTNWSKLSTKSLTA